MNQTNSQAPYQTRISFSEELRNCEFLLKTDKWRGLVTGEVNSHLAWEGSITYDETRHKRRRLCGDIFPSVLMTKDRPLGVKNNNRNSKTKN